MKTRNVCAYLISIAQCGVLAGKQQPGANPQKIFVGRFPIQLNDPRLPLQEDSANQTLTNDLFDLFDDVANYYGTYEIEETPTVDSQSYHLTTMAQSKISDKKRNYSEVLWNASYNVAERSFRQDKIDFNFSNPDVAGYYLHAIFNMTSQIYYYRLGAYAGTGFNSICADQINEVLGSKDEWAKLGSGAATTLMALLPTFLAFGNLYVPRSSEAYTTSALVGLTTAFYSFGLPTQSMSAVKSKNLHALGLLGATTLARIAKMGKKKDASQAGTALCRYDRLKKPFADMKAQANEWQKRWHWWHVPALAVSLLQIVIFAFAVYPLFQTLGVPKSLLACIGEENQPDYTGAYLGVSAAVNTVFRYARWETSSHERVKVYSLSDSARKQLKLMTFRAQGESTASHLPPLEPPYLLAIKTFFRCLLWWKPHSPASRRNPNFTTIWIRSVRSLRRRTSHVLKGGNLFDILRAGFIGDKGSARRWRPVYILIHLSTQSRNPFITLLTGFVEASLLLVLTFFFAAQWGGNLVLTIVALALLLVFVTIGRALGLFYVWLSSQAWGLTVVDCDDENEIRGVLRIMCSMEDVLVCVNGATYFGGHRLDGRDDYEGFLKDYETGQHDDAGAGLQQTLPT